jgi:thioredoxin-like negative regulator of GroEL
MIEVVKVDEKKAAKVVKALKNNVPVVVLYHLDGCINCTMMQPNWEACKQKLKKGNKTGNLCIAEVEYSQMHVLPSGLQGIQGFPTIKAFRDHKGIEYQGDRSVESLYKFLNGHVEHAPPKPKPKPKKKMV